MISPYLLLDCSVAVNHCGKQDLVFKWLQIGVILSRHDGMTQGDCYRTLREPHVTLRNDDYKVDVGFGERNEDIKLLINVSVPITVSYVVANV